MPTPISGNNIYLTAGLPEFKLLFHDKGIRVDKKEGTSILVEGSAGLGKTTFALQISTQAVQEGCSSCLYFSFDQTSSEISDMIGSFKFFSRDIKPVCFSWSDEINTLNPSIEFNIIDCHKTSDITVSQTIDKIRKYTEHFAQHNKSPILIVLDSIGAIKDLKSLEREHVKRLIEELREYHVVLILVSEQYDPFETATTEYLTNIVFELKKLSPKEGELLWTDFPRTVFEIVKTRNQPAYRGPHEFEVFSVLNRSLESKSYNTKNMGGIVIYPSLKSVASSSRQLSNRAEINGMRATFGIEDLDRWLGGEKSDPENPSMGIAYGQSILLTGDPGNYKTELGIQFLKQGLIDSPDQRVLFVSCKIEEAALDRVTIFEDTEQRCLFHDRLEFIDVRIPFRTLSTVMSTIRNVIEIKNSSQINRAVIFGIGMLETLPMFQRKALPFLQVLLNYFANVGIASILIDWPQPKDISTSAFAKDLVSASISVKKSEKNIENEECNMFKGRDCNT